MAGGDSHLVQVPTIQPFIKYAKGGMFEQLHNFKLTVEELLAGTQKVPWLRNRIPDVFIVYKVTVLMNVESL